MSAWLGFAIGVLVGGCLGFLLTSLLVAGSEKKKGDDK